MKKAIALFLVLLTLTACTSNKEKNGSTNKFPEEELMEKAKDNTKLTQYVDSIKTVFPNYEGNLVVQKKVSKEFEKQLTSFPGILEGSTFHLASMFEHEGKTCVAFMCIEESVNVWCMDYPEEEAAKLDKNKTYELTGGTIDHFEVNDDEVGGHFLFLGNVYVRGLMVKEI